MSIEINSNTVGIWFFSPDNQNGDLLVTLYRDPELQTLKILGRIRLYDESDPGNDAFSGKDKKEWFEATCKSSNPQEETKKAREFVELFKQGFGKGTVYEVLMDEKGEEDFKRRFWKMPFVHAKTVTKEEYEAEMAR